MLASASREAPYRRWEGPTPAGGFPSDSMEGALREQERVNWDAALRIV